jgi:flotillin
VFGYRVPSPNEAMLISGGKQRGGSDVTPFRIVVGHGAFVLPVVRKVSFLTLAMQEAEVIEDCYTQQGLTLGVRAVIAFKVADDPGSISNAARRFQADQRQMSTLVGRIFSGHLRSIIGSMTVESIIRDQQRLGEAILDASKGEMARIGLNVDSLQISQIDDKGSGYIAALAAPHQADVNRAANVARAAADQASAEAQQESDRNQAEFARQTAVARAEYQAEIDVAQQKAAQAGPLAAAQAQQDVLAEQAKVAAKNAVLREAQLQAEVVKPAQAEAERVRIQAEAAAHATRLSAQAAASEGRIALQQAVIAQLPDIMNSAAAGLQNANLTVLNGTQGVNEAIATLAAQGGAVLQSVLGSLHGIGAAPQLGGAATDGTGPDYGPPPEGDLPQA